MGYKLFVLALLLIAVNLASCQFFALNGRMTFNQAATLCRTKGARLAWVRNRRQLRLAIRALGRSGRYHWVGMDDRKKEGRFVWGGRVRASKRWNWAKNSPDNYGGKENCVVMGRANGYKFGDVRCNSRYGALCQRLRRRPVKCRKSYVKRGKCRRGYQRVIHFYYAATIRGCRRRKFVKRVRCGGRKRHGRFCRCSAVGDPHYRTYDGALIHFYGVCKYTLSKSIGAGACSFNIEVKNERRGRNRRVSYTRFVEVKMAGIKVRLTQRRRAFVDGIITSLPFAKGNVKVFYSGRTVQFVHKTCGVRVAFDGRSNAYLQVSGRYRGKMTGLCGNCNGNRGDDMRTSGGVRVRGRGAYNKIGDSYAVRDDSKGPAQCRRKKKTPLPPTKWCKGRMVRLINSKRFCGSIKDPRGPFANCLKAARINTNNLFSSCKIDICANDRDRRQQQKSRCGIYKALEERCNEKGITGINWRAKLGCPLHCGRNKEYTTKLDPCPKTCENHYFGTKRVCFKLPKREGCQCKPGFIRDGALCVKPKSCKCLEGCFDRGGTRSCRLWKRQGRCTRFPRVMRRMCPLTCGFCQPPKPKCEDHISTYRCMKFRRQGKCRFAFFRKICGLSCNLKRCPCRKTRVKKGACLKNKTRVVITISYTRSMRTHRCVRRRRVRREACGPCKRIYRITRGKCNLCNRRRVVTLVKQGRRGIECKRLVIRRTYRCSGCNRNTRTSRRCIGSRTRVFITSFNIRRGCFKCVRRVVRRRTVINCRKPYVKASRCSKATRRKYFRHVSFYARRCTCYKRTRVTWTICICPKNKVVRFCRNRRKVTVYTSYRRFPKICRRTRRIIRKRVVCPRRKVVRGKCNRKTCFAIDSYIRPYVNNKCLCSRAISKRPRRCCCDRPRILKYCVRRIGVIVRRRITYRLVYVRRIRTWKCFKRVRTWRKRKNCGRRGRRTVKIGRCNRPRCLRVMTDLVRWRKGCKCYKKRIFWRQRCCCPRRKSVVLCLRNRLQVRKTWVYYLVGGKRSRRCRVRTYKRVIRAIRCRNVVRRYRCNRRTRRQVTVIRKIAPVKCRCKLIRVIRRSKLCYCGPKSKRITKCNSRCQQRVTIITTRGPIRGKCFTRRRTYSRRCCCLKIRPRKGCNRRTGNKYIVRTSNIFVRRTRTCVVRRYYTVIRTICPRPYLKRLLCRITKSGYGYRKILRRYVWRVRSRCTCRSRVVVRRELCRCPLKRALKVICSRSGRYKIYRTRIHLLRGRKCVPIIRRRFVRVICLLKRRVIKSGCPRNCRQVITVRYRVLRKCRCLPRVVRRVRLCCCTEKPKIVKRCVGGVYYTRTKYYSILVRSRNRCFRRRRVISRRRVRCRRRLVFKRGPCKGCNRTLYYHYYSVRNCRCVKIRTRTRPYKCCCPPRRVITKCVRNARVTTTTYYRLIKGRCFRYRRARAKGTPCPRTRPVIKACTKSSRYMTFRYVNFYAVNCKCRKRVRILRRPCKCHRPRIVRGPCRRNRRTVYRLSYRLVGKRGICTVRRRNIGVEPCSCPITRRRTFCTGRAYKTVIVYYKRFYYYKSGVRLLRCIRRVINRFRAIRCRVSRIIFIPCNKRRAFRKYRIKIYYIIRRCRCLRRQRVISIRACTCKRKNRSFRYCYRGKFKRRVYHIWTAKGATCKRRIVRITRRVKCTRRKFVKISRRCNIRRGYGIYSQYIIKRYVVSRCKCVPTFRRKTVLCKCRKGTSYRRCVGGRKIYYKISYRRRKGVCRKIVRKVTRTVVCSRSVTARPSRCIRCSRRVHLVFWKRYGCRCLLRRRSVPQRCCCHPGGRKPKYGRWRYKGCVRGSKVWIKVIYILVATARYRIRIGRRWFVRIMRCKRIVKTKKRTVVCRRRPVVRRFCNRKSGIGKVVKYWWVRRGCRCYRRRSVRHHRCMRCLRRLRVRKGRCPPRGYFRKLFISFYVLNGLICRRVRRIRVVRCRCKKGGVYKRCDRRGNKIITTVTIRLVGRVCRRTVRRVVRPVRCGRLSSKERTIIGRCNKRLNKRIIKFVRRVLDRRNCRCKKLYRIIRVPCRCPKGGAAGFRCYRNVKYIRLYRYIRRNYRCIKVTKVLRKRVVCRRGVKTKLIRHCSGRGKKRIIGIRYNFVPRNCRCVMNIIRRSITPCKCTVFNKSEKRCMGGNTMIYISITSYRRGILCVKKFNKSRRIIRCRGKRRIRVRCNFKTCKRPYHFYVKKAINCKCKWVKRRTLVKPCCCLKKPTVTRSCLKGFLKKIRIVSWKFSYRSERCIRKVTVRTRRTKCPGRIVRHRKICRAKCRGVRLYYALRPVSCKCVLRVVKRKAIACCCPKSRRFKRCNKVRGILTKYLIIHIKRYDRCYRHVKRWAWLVKCRGVRVLGRSCKGKRIRVVRVFVKRRRGCRCFWKRTLIRKEPCTCPVKLVIKKTKCLRWYRYISYFRYFLVRGRRNRCVIRLLRRIRSRCRCPKPMKKTVCVRHYRKVTTIVRYRLTRKIPKKCIKKVRKYDRPMGGCTLRPKVVRRRYGRCNRRTRLRKVYIIRKVARNCRCRRFTRIVSIICACKKRTSRKVCIRKSNLIKTVNVYYRKIRKGMAVVCVKQVSRKYRRVRCRYTGNRRIVGRCYGRGRRRRILYYWFYFKRNCRCMKRLKRKLVVPCRCPRPRTLVRCIGPWKKVSVVIYRMINYRCKRRVISERRRIKCAVGVKKRNTKCIRNRYLHIIVRRWRRGCKCMKRVRRRSCHCKCRPNRVVRVCSRNFYFNKITYYSVRRGCRCKQLRRYNRIYPKCRVRPIVRFTKCQLIGKDRYRTRITNFGRRIRSKCACRYRTIKRRLICTCNPLRRKRSVCVRNRYVVTTWSARFVVRRLNRCYRRVYRRRSRSIRCGRNTRRVICNKKGVLIETIVRRYVRACKCRKLVRVRSVGRCRCNTKPKLIQNICKRRPNCRRVRVWRYERLVGRRCIPLKHRRVTKCCCPGGKTRKYCDARRGANVRLRVYFVLLKERCFRRIRRSFTRIVCKKPRRIRKKCVGVRLYITVSVYRRRGCRCRWLVIRRIILRCKCYKPRTSSRCYPRSRKIITRRRWWVLSRGRCYPRNKVTVRRIRCSRKPTIRLGKCNRRTGRIWKYVTRRYVTRRCRCRKVVRRYPKECVCLRKRTATRRCIHRTGVVVTTIKFSVLKRKQLKCVIIVERRRRKTVCKPSAWRLVRRKSRCLPVVGIYGLRLRYYVRRVRRGCRCYKRSRVERCHCHCRGRRFRRRCVRRSRLVTSYYKYRFNGCRCRRYTRTVVKRIRCKEPYKKIVSKCDPRSCRQKVTIVVRYVRRCSCYKRVRSYRRVCCCPKTRSSKRCNRARGLTIYRRVSFRYVPHRCIRKVYRRVTRTVCRKRPILKNPSRCIKRRYLVTVIRFVRRGCRCVKVSRRRSLVCPCKPPRTVKGKCSRRSCRQRFAYIYFILRRDFRCVRYKKIYTKRCCCKRRYRARTVCRGNRRYRISSWLVYVRRPTRRCIRKFKRVDTTPRCKRPRYVVRKVCNRRTGVYTITRIWRFRAACRCRRRVKVIRLRCRCPKAKLFKSCSRHKFIIKRRVWWVLIKGRCLKRKKRTTIPVACVSRRRTTKRCNRLTCIETIVSFVPFARNCRCYTKRNVVRRQCCCRNPGRKITRKCLASTGRRVLTVRVQIWLSRRRVCLKRTERRIIKIKCRKGLKRVVGRCIIRKNRRRYQIVILKRIRRVACRCVRVKTRRFRLCRCRGSRITKRCIRGVWIFRRYSERLVVVKGRRSCRRFSRVIRRYRKLCRKTPLYWRSSCVKGRRRYVKRIFRKVGCGCRVIVRRGSVPCNCPRLNRVVRSCLRNKTILKKLILYRTICPRGLYGWLKCRCVRRIIVRRRLVSCRLPSGTASKCVAGKRRVRITYQRLVNCKCVRKTLSSIRSCGCLNILTNRVCRAYGKTGSCMRSVMLRRLCKKTCGMCSPCLKKRHPKFRTRYVRKFRSSILVNTPSRRRFIIRSFRGRRTPRNYRKCTRDCTKTKLCKAVEFIKAGRLFVCLLVSISPREKKIFFPRVPPLKKVPNRVVFVRVCVKPCKKKITVIRYNRCRCYGRKSNCYRNLWVRIQKRNRLMRCIRRVKLILSPCNMPCVNISSKPYCKRVIRRGGCRKRVIKRRCWKSCMPPNPKCPCNKKKTVYSKCVKVGKRYRSVKFVVILRRWRGICTARIRRVVVSCKPPCTRRKYRRYVVGRCINGRRVVTFLKLVKRGGARGTVHCLVIRRRRIYSCRGCCPSVDVYVSPCRKGRMFTRVVYWARIRKCCRRRQIINRYTCDRCPRSYTRVGRCRYNRALRFRVWFHRSDVTGRCSRHVQVKMVFCGGRGR